MERYDGKTRKDDIKKYILIGLCILLVIVGISLLTGFLKRKNTVEPDYQVVVACSESLSQDVVEGLENAIGGVVGDRNGDGTVSVTVQALRLVDLSGNIDLADPDCPSRASLEGAPFLSEIGLDSIPFYGCVLSSGKTEKTNQAIDILRELKTAHVTLW